MPKQGIRARTQFEIGDVVQVRDGVAHPVYLEIALGGWTGVARKYDRLTRAFLVHWDLRTLERAPPEYGAQCEADGLDPGSTWVDAVELTQPTGA